MDGVVARLGEQVDPARQTLTLDGRRVRAEAPTFWMLHKPRGVLSAVRDARGQPTVVDLLPRGLPRLFPVGRLDLDTEGLVLLTNDGALTHALLHPSLGSEREYRVTARGRIEPATLRRLAAGVELADGATAPARVGAVRFDRRAGATRLSLVLREGRKRQIRRAFDALGHPVIRLVRTRLGPLRLAGLQAGRARPLAPAEIAALHRHARALHDRQRARSHRVEAARDAGAARTETSRRSRRSQKNP